jgi:cell division protein FtsB
VTSCCETEVHFSFFYQIDISTARKIREKEIFLLALGNTSHLGSTVSASPFSDMNRLLYLPASLFRASSPPPACAATYSAPLFLCRTRGSRGIRLTGCFRLFLSCCNRERASLEIPRLLARTRVALCRVTQYNAAPGDMRIVRQLWLPIILGLYVLLAVSTLVGQRGLLHLWKLRQDLRELEAQALTLLRENDALRERIARLQSDDEFLEKIVREELGYVGEKELVYRFRDSVDSSAH